MDIYQECEFLIKILATNIEEWIKINEISIRRLAHISTLADGTIRSIIKGSKNIELATLVKLKLSFSVELIELLTRSSIVPKIQVSPVSESVFKKVLISDQKKIGARIVYFQKEQELDPETLGILAFNIDYSDTLKYQRGELNLTLITILKFAHGLKIANLDLLNDTYVRV